MKNNIFYKLLCATVIVFILLVTGRVIDAKINYEYNYKSELKCIDTIAYKDSVISHRDSIITKRDSQIVELVNFVK